MKKIIFVLMFILIHFKSNAQPYVNIPDPVFRNYIDSIVPGSIVGNDLNTSHPGLQNVNGIDVTNMGIYTISGIEYFPGLTTLFCGNNFLSSLPALPNGIIYLGCNHNQITSITSLPLGLEWFHCEFNYLTSLPPLPSQVWELSCFNNLLTTLPALPQSLQLIWCSDCQITTLPALPANLTQLGCNNNQLSSLPTLPNSLTNLSAAGNPDLWCIPNIPNNGNFQSDIGTVVCMPQGTQNTWFKMANHPAGVRELATSFSIGSKCYLATGLTNGGSLNDLWEFNPATNAWTQKANVPGQPRIQATSFSIGNRGYVGLGQGNNPVVLSDFYEYNPASNSWLQKANYPDSAYSGNAAFSIGNKGYVGCGQRSGYVFPTTFYEFDPVANTWTQKANFPGFGRTQSGCFTIGNKGYVCGGDWANGLTNSCYCYNPSTNSWSSVASLPQQINEVASFSSNGRGYVAGGQCCNWNGTLVSTLMEYDPALNTWTQRADIPTTGRFRTTGCATNGKCYAGTGEKYSLTGNYTKTNDWWEYTPVCTTPSAIIYSSGNTSFCNGDSVMLFAENGNKYKWKMNGSSINGATSKFFYAKSSGTYTCVISNECDTVTSSQISVTVNPIPSAAITPGGPTTFCSGGSVLLNAPVAANRSYQWKKNGVALPGAISSSYSATVSGSYKVTVTNTNTGCSKTTGIGTAVTVYSNPSLSISPQGPTTFCLGDSVQLKASYNSSWLYQWKKNNTNISGATSNKIYAKTAGNYKVKATNVNGCTSLSNTIAVSVPCRQEPELPETNKSFDVLIYPNPSGGIISMSTTLPDEKITSVALSDAYGKLLLQTNPDAQKDQIDCTRFPDGIYFLSLWSGNGKMVNRKISILK